MEEFHNSLYLSPQEMMMEEAPRLLSRHFRKHHLPE